MNGIQDICISWKYKAYFDAWGSTYRNCSRWQIICRRRPSYLEQSATQHSWLDTVGGNICNTAENLPVCLGPRRWCFWTRASEMYIMMMIMIWYSILILVSCCYNCQLFLSLQSLYFSFKTTGVVAARAALWRNDWALDLQGALERLLFRLLAVYRQCQVTTLGKLFKHISLCQQAV